MKFTHMLLAATSIAGFASAAAAQEEIDIINCGAGDDAAAEVQAADIEAWMADNPDYTVSVEYVPWGQCQERAITLAAAGDPAAISYMGSRVLKQLAGSGLIRPFDLTEEETSSYEPSVLSTVQFDGEVWGLPRAFSTKALFWNRGLFEEAGLDMPDGPQSWDDVMTAAQAITENTDAAGIGIPAAEFDNTMHEFLNWLYANGGEVIDAEGNVVFDSPNNVETLQFMADLAPYMEDGPLAYDRAELEPLFREGQIAMYTNGGWGRAVTGDVDYGIVPVPAGPSGSGPSTLLITDSLVVFEGSGVEDAAMDLVKYLTETERQAAFDEGGGWTPIRQTAKSDELVAADPTWAVFIDAVPTGGPEPSVVDYVAMQDVINVAIQDVITGDATPEDAAAEAQAELEELAAE
ncbi:extracellular solute-binding protein [Wenxinia saemankumensis]|uniref:Carbohydrate ABC transporter substrate-binding protein, CUT1 family n=1 Tax=Wenxinia saemankumensis TaxID=1447782 RepID=A0A1M6HPP3_9RHOB|nr:extracellular solute-binding protein [Wenxinia saemankumensis]SHJ24116.1 carbohydrate ABC transporter substrate-binding protein, CUT1 family [Wenxinia saemankumensis]